MATGFLRSYRVSPLLALRVWQRELTLYSKIWKSTILSTLFDPVVYLLAMGFGLGSYITETFQGVTYLEFIAPGLVASAVMMGATYEIAWNSFARIYTERTYEAMTSTPATLEDVVAGELVWATTRSFINSAIMLAVLAAFGLVHSRWVLAVPLVAVLGGLMFSCVGLSFTARIRHMDHLTFYFTLFITPLYLFSGVFFPLDRLPPIVQQAAWFSPLHHLVNVVRGLVLGQVHAGLVADLAWMAVVTVAFFGLPAYTLRRKLLV